MISDSSSCKSGPISKVLYCWLSSLLKKAFFNPCSVPGGLDIRNNTGESVGARKPIASGNSKAETLPISTLILSLSEQADAKLFFSHWEDITGLSIDGVLSTKVVATEESSTKDLMEPYYPQSFFEASRSKRSLSFTSKSLRKVDHMGHLSSIRSALPVNPGDLLWLIHKFLSEEFAATSGDIEIDLANGSEHPNSIYRSIVVFCSHSKYKHHPHFRTFRAFPHVVEMGATERMIVTNALSLATEILREPFSKKKKTAVLQVNGQRKDSKRFVITVGSSCPNGTIREVEEPGLQRDAEVLEDYTDEEDEGATGEKRVRKDNADGFGQASSKAVSKAAKTGRGEKGKEDDMMLFD